MDLAVRLFGCFGCSHRLGLRNITQHNRHATQRSAHAHVSSKRVSIRWDGRELGLFLFLGPRKSMCLQSPEAGANGFGHVDAFCI